MTREEMMAVFYRYSQYKGYDVSEAASLTVFTDSVKIQSYAEDAMAWAVSVGLIVGFEDGTIRPQADSNRAQLATVLMRYGTEKDDDHDGIPNIVEDVFDLSEENDDTDGDGINDYTEIYLIGDTQTLVAYKDGRVTTVDNPNQKALQKLDKSVLDRMVELAKERGCDVLDTRTDDEIEKMLQVNRSKKNSNCADGYWVCGTTEGTAKHGVCVSFNNSELAGFVLASDGFDFSVLGLDEKQAYRLICERGTEVVSKLIRKQQEQDPKCNKFPRFKQGDDLTAVHFDYLARDKNYDYER